MLTISRDRDRTLLLALLAGAVVACRAGPGTTPAGSIGPAAARVEGTLTNGLRYVAEGTGAPLVLVHAFQTDLREWDEVAPVLAARYRVIRYDVRAHGRSAGLATPASASDDLRQLLDELGVLAASVAGLSMGSEIALDFALSHPARVDKVVMISPSVSGLRANVPSDWVRPIVAAVRANDRARAATLWWESPLLAGVRARGADAERYRTVINDNTRIWTENPANRLPLDPPAARRLEGLRRPLLVLVGADDAPGFHHVADTLVRRVGGARSEVVPDAGHMISMEKPAELAKRIGDFLATRNANRR